MPYGDPGGYRNARRGAPANRRNGNGRGGRGGGSNAALVSALQQVLQRFGGGRRGSATTGRLGKGARAMARTRAQRVGDNVGFGFEDDGEGNYADTGYGGVRVGYRK